MRNFLTLVLTIVMLAAAPLPLLAMDHEHEQSGMKKMDHAQMEHGGMSGMSGMSGMQSLGECLREEVQSRAEIKAYGADAVASMAKMGMDGTHHLMVYFNDMSGSEMTDGTVAVRVKGPDGQQSAPVKLMGMGKGFGGDIVLKGKGEFELEVGTKLKDGKKRVFEYSYEKM
jgi:hypothetical protein